MDQTVAIVAISTGATLGAAALGAISAQLALQRQLRSEEARFHTRLRFEKTLHDRAELRAVTEDAVRVIEEVTGLVGRPASPDWLNTAVAKLRRVENVLRLRLGREHKAAEHLSYVLEALADIEALYAEVGLFRSEEDEDEFWAGFDARRDEVAYQAAGFKDAVHAIVGARLSLPDSA